MALWDHLPMRRGRAESVEFDIIGGRDELIALLDQESRRILGLSAAEFLEQRANGTLPEHMGARTLSMLADLESAS